MSTLDLLRNNHTHARCRTAYTDNDTPMPRTTHTAVFSHIILARLIFWSLLGLGCSNESSIAHESVAVVVEGAVWSLEVAVWFFKFWFHRGFFAGER